MSPTTGESETTIKTYMTKTLTIIYSKYTKRHDLERNTFTNKRTKYGGLYIAG